MPSERSRLAELFGGGDSNNSVEDAEMGSCSGGGGTNSTAVSGNSADGSPSNVAPADMDDGGELTLEARLRRLYPMVDSSAPLPTMWNMKDKWQYIGLSEDCLTVQYKGHGKDHTDAASVRADHPIPAACGLYYFEVSIQ